MMRQVNWFDVCVCALHEAVKLPLGLRLFARYAPEQSKARTDTACRSVPLRFNRERKP